MSLMADLTDAAAVADNLPALIAELQAIVTDLKSQDGGTEKIAAVASGIAQLSATVAQTAASMAPTPTESQTS